MLLENKLAFWRKTPSCLILTSVASLVTIIGTQFQQPSKPQGVPAEIATLSLSQAHKQHFIFCDNGVVLIIRFTQWRNTEKQR